MSERPKRSILAESEGYLGLGMIDEAWNALEELSPTERARPAILSMRIRIFLQCDRAEDADVVARGLIRFFPDHSESWIAMARVQLAMNEVSRARRALQKAFEITPARRLEILEDLAFEAVW